MAKEVAPAFQLYIDEWCGSRSVQRMTFAQRGMYLEMLMEQWQHFSLPDSPTECAELIGGTVDEWEAAWPVLRRKFVERRAKGRPSTQSGAVGRLINLKLEQIRKERRTYRTIASKGGNKRALSAKRGKDGTYLPADHPADKPADIQASASTLSLSLSGSLSSSPSLSLPPPPTPIAEARSKRPIYQSDRFVVFEWQFDDIGRMLGPHTDGFDLHGFFDALTQQSRTSGLVIPRSGTWDWLQAQILAEAQRRGLPIATAADVPTAPTNKRIAGLAKGTDAFLQRVGGV